MVPGGERARIVALFMAAMPLSAVVGAPISGALLGHATASRGLAGWQWMFLIEGFRLCCSASSVRFLTDRPADAAG